MATGFLHTKNNVVCRLATGVDTTSATLTLLPGEGAQCPSAEECPFHVTLFEEDPQVNEVVEVVGVVGDVLMVTRGVEDTIARDWIAGTNVQMLMTAGIVSQIQEAVNALESALANAGVEVSSVVTGLASLGAEVAGLRDGSEGFTSLSATAAALGAADVSGAVAVGGDLGCGGVFENWSCWIPAREMWAETDLGAAGPTRIRWAWGRETQSYDFVSGESRRVCFSAILPRNYDGRALKYELLWSANDGTTGDLVWSLNSLVSGDGELLTEAYSSAAWSTDVFQGVNKVHLTSFNYTPTGAGVDKWFLTNYLFRRTGDDGDTFDGTARLLGVRISFA